MVVGEPEVEQDRADHRVDERLALVAFVGEVAEPLQGVRAVPRPAAAGGPALPAVAVEDGDPLFARALQPPGRLGIVEGAVGEDPVQLQNRPRESGPHPSPRA